ncbi:hypothetical protein [Ancylobacter sp. TS-1]|uniref:hypothetical protein n=1 Tax=Ancylobacter sp. TS-1 TaxID=1850374 RepID=UPI001391DA36|nr:hypothetical protein [Ancylobacter sp. TS-1]
MDSKINLRIPNRMHAVFAQKARETGFPLSEVIRQAMEAGMRQEREAHSGRPH